MCTEGTGRLSVAFAEQTLILWSLLLHTTNTFRPFLAPYTLRGPICSKSHVSDTLSTCNYITARTVRLPTAAACNCGWFLSITGQRTGPWRDSGREKMKWKLGWVYDFECKTTGELGITVLKNSRITGGHWVLSQSLTATVAPGQSCWWHSRAATAWGGEIHTSLSNSKLVSHAAPVPSHNSEYLWENLPQHQIGQCIFFKPFVAFNEQALSVCHWRGMLLAYLPFSGTRFYMERTYFLDRFQWK